MPSITLTGKPGSGKTTVACILAIRIGGRILSDVKINQHPAFIGPDGKDNRFRWDYEADKWTPVMRWRCGTIVADEIGLKLDARKAVQKGPDREKNGMTDEARDFLILHRQRDIFLINTVQLQRMVDVLYREMSDEIWQLEKREVPFIGWPIPLIGGAKRQDHICKFCKRPMEPGSDREWEDRWQRKTKRVWWKWLLGFGTQYHYTAWEPLQLDDKGKPLPGEEPVDEGNFNWFDGLKDLYDSQGCAEWRQDEDDAYMENRRAGGCASPAGSCATGPALLPF